MSFPFISISVEKYILCPPALGYARLSWCSASWLENIPWWHIPFRHPYQGIHNMRNRDCQSQSFPLYPWTTPLSGSYPVMWIPQGSIVSETAYEMESHCTEFIDKVCLWEPGICDNIGSYGEQSFAMFSLHVKIPVHKIVSVRLVFQSFIVRCLLRSKHYAVMHVHINNSDSEDFKPSFYSRGTARPELPDIRSLFPSFDI